MQPNMSYYKAGHQRVFMHRLTSIKEEIDQDLQTLKISRSDPNRFAPKGGVARIKEEKARKLAENPSLSVRFNPSLQNINELSSS